jgi:hypothetical protein
MNNPAGMCLKVHFHIQSKRHMPENAWPLPRVWCLCCRSFFNCCTAKKGYSGTVVFIKEQLTQVHGTHTHTETQSTHTPTCQAA